MKASKRSKRFLLISVCMTILLSCSFSRAFSASESIKENLTVGVPANRQPIFYSDPQTKEIVGIGVDLMRAAADEAGYEVSFRFIEDKSITEALENREYDLVMPLGSAIPAASGQQTIITDALIQAPFALVTDSTQTLPAMKNLKVGMLYSLIGMSDTIKAKFPGMEIVTYDTMDESVEALHEGKVDALLNNSYVWSYVLQKPSYGNLVIQPSAMISLGFCAGTADTASGRAVVERLNKGISAITDTQRQAIVLDYTTRHLYEYDLSDYIYKYGVVIILLMLLFASLAVINVQKKRALVLKHEEHMRYIIDHDPLTGLMSLNGFRKRVVELLQSNPDIPYFLSYNNIRNFKFINDSLGMKAGDDLLKFWAKKSRENLSEEEEAIGRIDGDHFAVLRHIAGEERMRQDEINVLEPVSNYFTDQGIDKQVQICSGIYVLSQEDFRSIDVDHMLDCARIAEKRVREGRQYGFEFYNIKQWESGQKNAEIVSHLSAAMQSGEIQVWYQPQVDYASQRITGAEALCRWIHPKLGWISPGEFIPALEEAMLIFELDSFVWERVCQDLQRWNEQGHRMSVSVNVSRDDIQENRDIPGYFRDLIRKYGLSPDQLHIEITETAYAEDSELLINTTNELRKLGFRVEMDDFGSGYSSLHMLKEVPVDRIKLDLRFLTDCGDREKGRIIVSHIIQMVRSLGIDLIAEGVENNVQAEFLQSRDCLEMQGFYFYKPMPVQEFEKITEN